MDQTGGRYLIKIAFDVKIKISIFEISNVPNFDKFWINFETDLCLAGGKYLIKIIFDIKIEIGIFEISNMPNFNKFGAFLMLGSIWA